MPKAEVITWLSPKEPKRKNSERTAKQRQETTNFGTGSNDDSLAPSPYVASGGGVPGSSRFPRRGSDSPWVREALVFTCFLHLESKITERSHLMKYKRRRNKPRSRRATRSVYRYTRLEIFKFKICREILKLKRIWLAHRALRPCVFEPSGSSGACPAA